MDEDKTISIGEELTKSAEIVKQEEAPEGVIRFILTTRARDRDDDVVVPMGGRFDNFKNNPVFLWVHDSWKLPIGKVLMDTMTVSDDRIEADVLFDLKDPFAAEVYRKFKDGFLHAGSIRFRIKNIGDQVAPDHYGLNVTEWELIEFSAVTIPANPQALALKSLSKCINPVDGTICQDKIREIIDSEATEPEPLAKTLEERIAAIEARISLDSGNIESEPAKSDAIDIEFTDVVAQMEALLAGEVTENEFLHKSLYDVLSGQYLKHDKTPPEYTPIKASEEPPEGQDGPEPQNKQNKDDIVAAFRQELRN